MELPPGTFGENFTIEGLLETEVNIGDRFRIGATEVMATAPRLPCYKLGIKFGRPDIIKRLLNTKRTGFYFSVLREGEVQAGDKIERLELDQTPVTVDDIVQPYISPEDPATLQKALITEFLPESCRGY